MSNKCDSVLSGLIFGICTRPIKVNASKVGKTDRRVSFFDKMEAHFFMRPNM